MIKDGSKVVKKSDPNGPIGTVSKSGAAVAGLTMNNPQWEDNRTVFVIFDDPKGINMGWYNISELKEVRK